MTNRPKRDALLDDITSGVKVLLVCLAAGLRESNGDSEGADNILDRYVRYVSGKPQAIETSETPYVPDYQI